jgi:hypothetical protein
MANKYSNPFGHRTRVSPSPTHPACRSHAELAQDYPFLAELAKDRDLDILAIYKKADLMDLFLCSEKTIRRWTDAGLMPNRRLPRLARERRQKHEAEQATARKRYIPKPPRP